MQKLPSKKQANTENQHNPEFTNLVHTGGSVTTASFFYAFTGYKKS
jgi:hypothetical protein